MERKEQKTKWKSEFSMGELYFERFHKILMALDELAVSVRMYDRTSILTLWPYFATLKQLYINVRPPMHNNKRKDYEKAFSDAEKEIIDIRKKAISMRISIKPHRLLEKIHQDLLEDMQYMGYGIVLTRIYSETAKMKKVLGLGRKNASGTVSQDD